DSVSFACKVRGRERILSCPERQKGAQALTPRAQSDSFRCLSDPAFSAPAARPLVPPKVAPRVAFGLLWLLRPVRRWPCHLLLRWRPPPRQPERRSSAPGRLHLLGQT